MDAAVKVVGQRGTGALTLREAARRAGVSHAAVYHHFRDKQDLLAAVAEEGYRELARRMDAAGRRAPAGPVERMHALARAYVQFAAARPTHFQVMSEPQMHSTGMEREALREAHDAALGRLVETVAEAQRAGELVGEDPSPIAIGLWTLVHGYAESHRTGRGLFASRPGARLTSRALDDTLRPLLEQMIRGVSAPGS